MMNGAEEPAVPAYRQPREPGIPKLDRGIVWSLLVLEMEEEHAARLAREAEKITPFRPGRIESGDPAEGLEEAA